MGLLEKALQYKKEMNKKGKETLIDTIIGPAETELIHKKKSIDITSEESGDTPPVELDSNDLKSIEIPDDELFILPDESNTPQLEKKADAMNTTSIAHEMEAVTLENSFDYLGPEDEPDIHMLNMDEDKNVAQGTDNFPNNKEKNIKFKIVENPDQSPNPDSYSSMKINNPLSNAELSEKPDKKFQDFFVLYEIGKEIVKSRSLNELYDAILFSVMGQFGSASATLLIFNPQNKNLLVVADSRGITIKNKNVNFDITKGLFEKLIQSKGVVDIEQYKQDPQYRDEYYQLIAIDARLFVPLRYNSNIYGAMVLGEKITIGDYSEEEINYIMQISEMAAIAYEKISNIEQLQGDIEQSIDERKFYNSISDYKQSLRKYPQKGYFIVTAQSIMKTHGVLSYAVFIKNYKDSSYALLLTDEEDVLLLNDSIQSISCNSSLINYIVSLPGALSIEDFDRNKSIRDIFSEGTIRKMTLFWIYPYKVADELLGFICVFRLRDYQQKDVQFERFKEISDLILSHYFSVQLIESQYNNYVDVVLPVFNRIDKELNNAGRLSIPLTIILFTIKNLKRYYAIQGYEKTRDLLNKVETIIVSRLSDGDFVARVNRNEFIIVLPGKNKKFAVPFTNALKNEIVQHFSQKELQLLVTFLMAEYPEDGNDLFSLLDAVY